MADSPGRATRGRRRSSSRKRRSSHSSRGHNWIGFKYTKADERRAWIDTVDPFAKPLLQILQNINWDGFSYEGNFLMEQTLFTSDPLTHEEITENVIEIVSGHTTNNVSYIIFGGGACELYGVLFKKPDIRKYLDFTGDLDVTMRPPAITFDKDIEDNSKYFLYNKTTETYTDYGNALTSWVFQRVVESCARLQHVFAISKFILPNKNASYDTSQADLLEYVGNIMITRSVVENMIKIQVSLAIADGKQSNHVLEFIFLNVNEVYERQSRILFPEERALSLNIKTPFFLLMDQIYVLDQRYMLAENALYSHKFHNHCARILYLLDLIRMHKKEPGFTYYGTPRIILNAINKHAAHIITSCDTPGSAISFMDNVKTLVSAIFN